MLRVVSVSVYEEMRYSMVMRFVSLVFWVLLVDCFG